MKADFIHIGGAKTHNLKNITLSIPRNQLTIITGISGSGKSSLAFDTIYAEGQRRYVESLSAYARQFLSMMEKPDIDYIEGLSPAISIEQKASSHNPRSTVGTTTEIYDYLRLLFARTGEPHCPTHGYILQAKTVSQMVDEVLSLPQESKVMILAPIVRGRKGEHVQLIKDLQTKGYIRARIDGEIYELDQAPALALHKKHNIEVVVDRFKVRADLAQRLSESFENALNLAQGRAIVASMEEAFPEKTFSSLFACPECGFSLSELEPRLFSFNNPAGACPSCDGLGVQQFFDPKKMIRDKTAPLKNILPDWLKKKISYTDNWLLRLAQSFHFNLETSFDALEPEVQSILLYGSDHSASASAKKTQKHQGEHYEGLIPYLERRYKNAEASWLREELSKYQSVSACTDCEGTRLRTEARHVFIHDKNLPQLTALSIEKVYAFFENFDLQGYKGEIAKNITKEIKARLRFLLNVGLEYLSLDRSAESLSGGEAQRIRLASQIGSGLVGVMYILDEPSIGLHQRDNERLLNTLFQLRDLGNTVIVVEHDEAAIASADFVVDIGPGAGIHGGEILAAGTVDLIKKQHNSLTGKYLTHELEIHAPSEPLIANFERCLSLEGVNCNNLKNLSVKIPLKVFTCVTGVSGSGKSSLITDTLYPLAANRLNRANLSYQGSLKALEGLEHCDKVIDINQSPIGRTPRSNPATYTSIFTAIRELFALTPEARSRGYQPGRFSFNVKGGRCAACEGDGVMKVEMHFLPDVYVACDLCKGKRYNRETLDIQYKGKNIHEVLELTVEDALSFFEAIPSIAKKCQILMEVGLGYIKLGQNATTLSGGEAQRIKLAKELAKRDTGNTLYILDEPTTGLHFADIQQLLNVLFSLRDKGNTLIIIEHNLDVIKTADWIIDIGPEGGEKGGQIIASGTPKDVAAVSASYTGQFLKKMLA